MSQHLTGRAARSLAMIFCATALVACGGGDDPPAAQNPNPNPQPSADFAFATPSSETATVEKPVDGIVPFTFAATPAQQTPGTVQFENGVVSYSASLASNVDWAGAGLRFVAPGGTAVNASSYTKLKVQAASTLGGAVTIKLQTTARREDGCVPTASVIVTGELVEREVALNSDTFTIPSHCTASLSFSSATQALAFVEISNDGATAGEHDVKLGTIKLGTGSVSQPQ